MTRPNLVPGIDAVAFGILLFLAMLIADPPGGEYSETDITNYLETAIEPPRSSSST